MEQIVYIQGAICFSDLLGPGFDFSRHISVYFNTSSFYIPKYTADIYGAEGTCN